MNSMWLIADLKGAGIGTGLWVGTGSALAKAGPAGIAVTYTMMA